MKKLNLVMTIAVTSFIAISCSQQDSYEESLALSEQDEAEYSNTQEKGDGTGEYSYEWSDEEVNKMDIAPSSDVSGGLAQGTYAIETKDKKDASFFYTNNGSVSGFVASKNNASVISSQAMSNPFKNKKFIKTSNLKFKVKDVYSSSVSIENILIQNGGFLLNSNLNADIVRSQTFMKDKETNIQVNEFITTNYITLRVPNEKMHETLLMIAEEIQYLDYRHLNAEDIGLILLEQQLAEKRAAQSQVKIQNNIANGGKLADKNEAEQIAFNRQKEADIAAIKQLSLQDQVNYSTITLEIYQDTELYTTEIHNFDTYKDQYKKAYSSELIDSFKTSIEIIKEFIAGIISIWPILFILIAVIIFARKWWKRR